MGGAVIRTLLVANRGEIASRVLRTARSMGIRTVAVFVDADAGAPFVRQADDAFRLEGSYLDGPTIIAAARASGAEAVHPGYGFLSESAAFARLVLESGLIWIGPSPEVIEAMGDKLAAKAIAERAGVPVLPSVQDPVDADSIGYPLLVKAAAGGGGKGMRVVEVPDELGEAVAAARREAATGFGDDRVFLERYVPRSRHVEIQVLGDSHGNLVHLGERECSIQRRHQKVIEEAPSPAVDPELRAAMGASALTLAAELGYQSAGTVEFLLDDATGEHFFLEVNTRLQVEHPVTEAVTGLDLVREQIRVASGEPLGFGQGDVTFSGHAMEARLYAEDTDAGFLPATGTVVAFTPAAEPALRWDVGIEVGTVVGLEFDPMLAKVIAHASTRTEAAGRLALGLERLHLGGVTTNARFLSRALRHPVFLAGETTTDFIDRTGVGEAPAQGRSDLTRAAVVAALWRQGRSRAGAPVLSELPSGWRNARLPDEHVGFVVDGATVDVRYRSQRDGAFRVEVAWGAETTEQTAIVHRWSEAAIDIEVDRLRSTVAVTAADDVLYVQGAKGTLTVRVTPRFPIADAVGPAGGLTAPMPGVVSDVRVAAGDQVSARQVLVVLEAMKMEHHITAPVDGVISEVRVKAGDQVGNGDLLLVLDDSVPEDSVPEDPVPDP